MKKQTKHKPHLSILDNTKIWRTVGFSSLGLLGLLGILTLSPISPRSADALDNTARSAATRLTVDAAAAISVSLEDGVEMDVTPSVAGEFVAKSVNLGVRTNSREGYNLSMQTANGKTTLSSTASGGAEITSTSAATSGSAMAANTWGYTLVDPTTTVSETTIFSPISAASASQHFAMPEDGEQNFNLGFGAKVSSSLPAGKYSNEVIVSVVASPEKITTLGELVFMQDMTPEICERTEEGVEKKLYDIRDGKQYYAAKLKDGNCWMTQNLAYDLVSGRTLTAGDTDLGLNGAAASWTVPTSTETEIPNKEPDNVTLARSWGFGEVVLTNPTGSSLCPKATSPTGLDGDQYNSAWYGQKLVDTCPQWYRDVTGLQEGKVATATESIVGNTYDAHYTLGNYYQWGAITAGTGIATDTANTANGTAGLADESKLVDATASICPKGWKLPTSGAHYADNKAWPYAREDSFYNLLAAYGYPETGASSVTENPSTGWVTNNGYPYTHIVGTGKTRLDYSPLYFVRSGDVYSGTGSIRYAGDGVNYWSSTAYPGSATLSYNLYFNTSNVYSASRDSRVYGLSARCLAR